MNIKFASNWPASLNTTRIGLIRGSVVCRPTGKDLISEIKQEESRVKKNHVLGEINKIPTIADAREAYKLAGSDPSRYRPSADSLLRRIVKGQELYLINNVVDALNLVSIRTGFSIGGYDEQKLKGELSLGLGKLGEEYSGIGRGQLNITNLPVLIDDNGAFGSPTSDSVRTSITENTTRIALFLFDFGHNIRLDDALAMMKSLLLKHCKGRDIISLSIDIN